MAEINFKLSKREADALQHPDPFRKSAARRAAEFKLRAAIWKTFPELREVDIARAEREAHEDDHHRSFRMKVLGR